jgi:hypothetical protein
MKTRLIALAFAAGLGLAISAQAKLPPPPPAPPMDDAAKAAAEAKKKAAADKGKADQVAAEERAVKSFQANMKKAGKPVPKPTPIAAAPAAPAKAAAPAKPAEKAPAKKS